MKKTVKQKDEVFLVIFYDFLLQKDYKVYCYICLKASS